MDSPAKSDSSGGRRPRKRKLNSKVTPLEIKDNGDGGLTIGLLSLDKPSGVRNAPNWDRKVCLDLANPSDQFSLSILRGIHHVNILHLEAILETGKSDNSSYVKICVEQYTESLYSFASLLKISPLEYLVTLQKLLRQVTEGLDELRLNGLYHGNLNIHTTYVDRPTGLVKLANFKEKGEHQGLLQAQIEDWHAAGAMFEEISALFSMGPRGHCILLDDLAQKLKNLSPLVMLNQVKNDVLDHVFFWNRHRRGSFFIYNIHEVLHHPEFKSRVENLQFIPIDWNGNDHEGLLTAMNKYRTEKKMPVYGEGRLQYVTFVSGAYTHEDELNIQHEFVDNIIMQRCPRLCLELVKIMQELGYVRTCL